MKILILLFALQCVIINSFSQSFSKERITHLRKSVVRISIKNDKGITISSGTGFFVKEGYILTCFHVIIPAIFDDNNLVRKKILNIYIELTDGRKFEANISKKIISKPSDAQRYDYCILFADIPNREHEWLKIGDFNNAPEGAEIYTSGYPLGINEQCIAKGLLSTKFNDTIIKRDEAWMDITLNRGNSGGPIIMIGTSIDEDEVIGIVDHGLTPGGKAMEDMEKYFTKQNKSPAGIYESGVRASDVFEIFSNVLSNCSLGVNACVSINYCKSVLY